MTINPPIFPSSLKAKPCLENEYILLFVSHLQHFGEMGTIPLSGKLGNFQIAIKNISMILFVVGDRLIGRARTEMAIVHF